MKSIIRQFRKVKNLFIIFRQYLAFYERDFTAPSPNFFKMKTLTHFAKKEGVWIETGTYMGGTTEYLAKRFPKVISIEPSDYFFDYAKTRLRSLRNVTLLKGSSEEQFENALISSGTRVNIWLDGHYSEGNTFLGSSVTPILDELNAVKKHKQKFDSMTLFIDDIRLFARSGNDDSGYPSFQLLLDWCSENGFEWQIQNDILIAEMV